MDNTTTNNPVLNNTHVGWVSEPDERGTFGLLWSCLFTIFICSWSTLHLNVPACDDSPSTIFFRKLKWMGIALIIPEVLLVLALAELHYIKATFKRFHSSQSVEEVCISS